MNTIKTVSYLGLATIALTGCSIPRITPQAPEPAQLQAPTPQPAQAPVQAQVAPAQVQVAADAPEAPKPKSTWGHVPIGNTGNSVDGGDEDSGWSG